MTTSSTPVPREETTSLLAGVSTATGPSDAAGRAIPLRPAGAELPLFLVHEGAGSVGYAQALLPHVDAAVPVYALPAPAAAGPALRTVEGMATRLLRMILEVQPRGPYRLGGWSLGGTLAYEVATQLVGRDHAVELVALIDAPYLSGLRAGGVDARSERALVLHGLRAAGGVSPSAAPEAEAGTAEDADLEPLVARWREKGWIGAEAGVADAREIRDRLRATRAVLREYFPVPIPAPVHLFAARDTPAADPSRGWRTLLPGASLKVTPVPGTQLSLLDAENVRALGEALSAELRRAPAARRPIPEEGYSPLVTLRFGKGDQAPLFCVPGAGASISGFAELLDPLDPAWAVHGLQPRGLDGEMVPHATVEAAAESCLRAVAKTYPSGPVHLLGHSFGGWVVFEMAQRLRAAGREVGSLTLLDTEVPDADPAWIDEHENRDAFLQLVKIFEQVSGRSLGLPPGSFDALDVERRLAVLHAAMVRLGMMPQRSQPDVLLGSVRTFAACLRTTYHPGGPYPGPMRLVLVRDPALDEVRNQQEFAAFARGWRRWAPALQLTIGEGNHMTALKAPHVRSLAAILTTERDAGARR